MKIISYSDGEKRLADLNEIADLSEVVYLDTLKFLVNESRHSIINVDFSIYILFVSEIQFNFDHDNTDKFCKFELREIDEKLQVTAFYYKDKKVYPVIKDIEMKDIFKSAEDFFK